LVMLALVDEVGEREEASESIVLANWAMMGSCSAEVNSATRGARRGSVGLLTGVPSVLGSGRTRGSLAASAAVLAVAAGVATTASGRMAETSLRSFPVLGM